MASNHNPQDWNATPDFDEWGWDSYWSMTDWLNWHNALINKFGQPLGNDRWVQAWSSRISFWQTFGDVRGNWLLDPTFREYLRGYNTTSGITMLDAILGGDPLNQGLGWVSDLISSAGGSVTTVVDGANNTAKVLRWLVPALLIVAAALAVWIIFKSKPQIKIPFTQ